MTARAGMPDPSLFFNSTSVAVIGGTPQRQKLGSWPTVAMKQLGFEGKVTVVNPNYTEVLGYRCVASIADLPDSVTAALIVLPALGALRAVQECGERGIRHLVIASAGFGEAADGQDLQAQLDLLVEKYNLAICGPNSNGLANVRTGLALSFQPFLHANGGPSRGTVSLIAQSGQSISVVGGALAAEGVGLCYTVACGNQLTFQLENYLEWMAQQDENDVIALFIESIRDARALARALDLAARSGKRVVALKIGASEQARSVVASHTGALAGSYANTISFLEKHGVICVESIEDLVAATKVLSVAGPPSAGVEHKIACLTISGGLGALVADTFSRLGTSLVPLGGDASERLRRMGVSSQPVNPYDLAGRQDYDTVKAVLETLADDGFNVIILALGLVPDEVRDPIARALQEVAARFNLVAVYSANPAGDSLADTSAVVSSTMSSLVRAIVTWVGMPAIVRETDSLEHHGMVPPPPVGEGLIDEASTKSYMKQLGVAVPRGEVIGPEYSSVPLVGVRPVVVKGISSEIDHKSDLGLVAVGVYDDARLAKEIERIRLILKRVGDPSRDILVEEMVVGGIETVVGCVRDDVFGPVLVIGSGGVFVEVLSDSAVVILPATRNEIRMALARTALGRILAGHRGTTYDVEALLDVAMAVQSACLTYTSIQSLELNPVFTLPTGEGAIAADAKLRLS